MSRRVPGFRKKKNNQGRPEKRGAELGPQTVSAASRRLSLPGGLLNALPIDGFSALGAKSLFQIRGWKRPRKEPERGFGGEGMSRSTSKGGRAKTRANE